MMPNTSFLCLGELLLRLGPPDRELLLQSGELKVYLGGAEANTAAALSAFGHKVQMLSALPDGPMGEFALAELRRRDIGCAHIRRVSGRIGLYFLNPGAMLRPSEVYYDRADSVFAQAKVADWNWADTLDGVASLHLSGISPAVSESAAQLCLHATKQARDRQIQISFDCNYRRALWERWQGNARTTMRQLIERTQVLFADPRDIAFLLQTPLDLDISSKDMGGQAPDPKAAFARAAEQAFDHFPELNVIACTHRDERSVDNHRLSAFMAVRGAAVYEIPGVELAGIVDRIGTGDAFAAGLLHGLKRDWAPQKTLAFAHASGCLKHGIPGDMFSTGEQNVLDLVEQSGFQIRR